MLFRSVSLTYIFLFPCKIVSFPRNWPHVFLPFLDSFLDFLERKFSPFVFSLIAYSHSVMVCGFMMKILSSPLLMKNVDLLLALMEQTVADQNSC